MKSKQKLSQICKIFSGGTPSTKNETYWNGDFSWLSSGETRNTFITNTEKKITLSGIKNSSTSLAMTKDVVIASAGQGHTRGQASLCLIDTYVNQSIVVLRSNPKILLPEFLFYNIKSRYQELRQLSDSHSSRGSLPINILSELIIELPSLDEQKKISKIFYDLDKKIHNLQQQNEVLEQIAQTIFKYTFIDFNEATHWDNSDFDKIPKKWKRGKIKDLIKLFDHKRIPLSSMERMNKKGNFPYYGATKLIDFIDDYIFDGTFVLLGEDGSVIHDDGTPFIQYVDGKFWANNHTHVIQGIGEYSNEFIYLFFKNLNVKPWITGGVQLKINQGNLLSIPIIIPPEEILKKFNQIIFPIFSNILYNEKLIFTLTKTHDTLLPKLMSGDIRV